MKTYDDENIFAENQESRLILRSDNELFNEDENNVIHPVINVKKSKSSKNGEHWEILVNGKSLLMLKSARFSNTEKNYLRSADGMRFLLTEYKSGKKSVVKIKEALKKVL